MTKNLLLAAAFALLFSFLSVGQEAFPDNEPVVESLLAKASPDSLNREPIPLGEVEVSSLRVNRRIREVPLPMAVVGTGNFLKLSSQTLSNVLGAEPGIAMGRDGAWSTTISIRGLSENRLVTLVDGHRVETATDLTASFSMIDVNDIERVEVIKGAQSSLYGTGAMGGIVNIITKEGRFAAKPYVSGNATLGYGGVNKLLTEHASVNTGATNWYVRLSGTHAAAGDLRTPEGRIPNSQFTTNNVTAKAGLKPRENHLLRVQYQNNRSTNVGIPGGSAFPGPATATYTDISRHLFSTSYEITGISGLLASVKANYFTQYIQRNVEMIPNTVTETKIPTGTQRVTPERVVPIGNHLTHGGQLQTTWTPGEKNTLIAGVDLWSRTLRTVRTKYLKSEVLNPAGAVVKTNHLVRGETPIPMSSFTSGGIFVQDEARLLNDRLTLITGGRVDGIRVENEAGYDIDYLIVNEVRNDTPPNQRITFPAGKNNTLSWSANAGMLYKVTKETDLTLNLARSFRAPSIEELFKYIDLGNFVSLGDPDLKPENGASADVGIRIWKPRFNLQVNGFVNRIGNLVVETPGEFIYTLNTGPLEGTQDTLPALINANVSKALLYGADFGMQYNMWPNVVVLASGSYVRGKDLGSETDLPRIPPLNGRLGLRYTMTKYGSAELTMVNAARQGKIAKGEKATGGYTRFDLALMTASVHLGTARMQLFAGIDNLTDKSYTNHLATNRGGISVEPGRNIYLRLSLAF